MIQIHRWPSRAVSTWSVTLNYGMHSSHRIGPFETSPRSAPVHFNLYVAFCPILKSTKHSSHRSSTVLAINRTILFIPGHDRGWNECSQPKENGPLDLDVFFYAFSCGRNFWNKPLWHSLWPLSTEQLVSYRCFSSGSWRPYFLDGMLSPRPRPPGENPQIPGTRRWTCPSPPAGLSLLQLWLWVMTCPKTCIGFPSRMRVAHFVVGVHNWKNRQLIAM